MLKTGSGVSALQDQFLTTTTSRTGQEASEATRASLQLLVDVGEARDWKRGSKANRWKDGNVRCKVKNFNRNGKKRRECQDRLARVDGTDPANLLGESRVESRAGARKENQS